MHMSNGSIFMLFCPSNINVLALCVDNMISNCDIHFKAFQMDKRNHWMNPPRYFIRAKHFGFVF